MRNCGLGRHPTWYQVRRSGCLDDAFFAGTAGILRAAGDDHAELGDYDIKPLADILANHMPVSATTANRAVQLGHLFDARQIFGQ